MAQQPLAIRKIADKSVGARVRRYDPETGEPVLVNPDTDAEEPWPLLGIQVEGNIPQTTRVPTSFVAKGRAEGWITVTGEQVVHRPGGPPDDQWRLTHTFVHLESVTFKTMDGDIRYRVTHQPDKYVDSDDPLALVTDLIYAAGDTRVDSFYDLERES